MRENPDGVPFVYEGNFFEGYKHGHGTYQGTYRTAGENDQELFVDGMWHFGRRAGYKITFKGKSIDQEEFSSCSDH